MGDAYPWAFFVSTTHDRFRLRHVHLLQGYGDLLESLVSVVVILIFVIEILSLVAARRFCLALAVRVELPSS